MAPSRKRRSRSSAPTIPTPESATNSIATSSPSSNRNSRSDDNESDRLRSKRHLDLPMSPDIDTTPTHQLHNHHNLHHHPHNNIHTHHSNHHNSHHTNHHPLHNPNSQRTILRTVIPPSVPAPAAPRDARTIISAATVAAEAATGGDPTRFTVASVALRLYDQLIDWAVLQVAVQYKHHAFLAAEERRRAGAFPTTGQRSTPKVSIVPGSCGSRLLFSDKSVNVECSNCRDRLAASRYAPHLEKCLGRGGRPSSRAASARIRASERADKEAAADTDDARIRRRRHSSAAKTADHDVLPSLSSTSHAHKRRKMSPVPGGPNPSVGHSVLNSRGLPPSGRTRASPK